jgi:hypothetical protein
MTKQSMLVVCLVVVGCGGSPTQPAPNPTPNPAPQPQTWSIGGRIMTTLSGDPVASASLVYQSSGVGSGSDGRWTLTGTGAIPASLAVTVSAPGYITRQTTIRGENGRVNADIDIIRDAAPFNLAVYRQMVRDGLEDPAARYQVERWQVAPRFFIEASLLSGRELTQTTEVIRSAVSQFVGTQFADAISFEFGSGVTAAPIGTIEVRFFVDPNSNTCGRALVGKNPGRIEINYGMCAGCNSDQKIAPEPLAHEVGHALGFYHTETGIMATESQGCGNITVSEAERHHARIAYSRPNGNMDIDRDPTTYSLLQAPMVERRVIECRRR